MNHETVNIALSAVAKFCSVYSEICNAHTVDFIVHDRWKTLPENFRDELSKMTLDQLQDLPKSEFLNDREYPCLFGFFTDARKHTIEGMSELLPQLPDQLELETEISTTVPTDFLMSTKKCHEVKAMSTLVSSLATRHGANTVIDFGTGKGYLAANLALNHSLNVLGIDSSEGNCRAAGERNAKLVTRFKNKTKSKLEDVSKNSEDMRNNTNPDGFFIGKTLTIEKDTNFRSLLDDFVSSKTPKDEENTVNEDCSNLCILLSGLHVCGNLCPCLVKHFVTMKEAKVLCAVGCCYQHIQEQFCQDKFCDREQPDFGFPLSKQLLENKYSIGRNARMLASQGLDRIIKNGSLQYKHLFYRAVLQAILKDYGAEAMDMRVGKLAAKCSDFKDYVRKALDKLQIEHIQVSNDELDDYMHRYKEEEKKLCALHTIRIFLAPCIEALILLDRLAYLLEQEEVKEAYLLRLFDPVVSPRCYAAVAIKH